MLFRSLVPYFQFLRDGNNPELAKDIAAKSEWFALATKAAVEFYQHLRTTADWKFDAMYWLGDDSLAKVAYATGGPYQTNPAHFVDLLAALASVDFLKSPRTDQACCYAGPQEYPDPATAKQNTLMWNDLPLTALNREEIRIHLLEFLLAGAVHTGFFYPLLHDARLKDKPSYVPWYYDLFARRGHNLETPEAEEQLANLRGFFADYHFPWWLQVHGEDANTPENVRLLNRVALQKTETGVFVDMFRLANLQWPARNERVTKDYVDRFFTDAVVAASQAVPEGGAASYLSMLGLAAQRFAEREYQSKKHEG